MSSVQVEQKSYEMPPREGFTVAHFLTVADIDRDTLYAAGFPDRDNPAGLPPPEA
jgi:hypothetical protein